MHKVNLMLVYLNFRCTEYAQLFARVATSGARRAGNACTAITAVTARPIALTEVTKPTVSAPTPSSAVSSLGGASPRRGSATARATVATAVTKERVPMVVVEIGCLRVETQGRVSQLPGVVMATTTVRIVVTRPDVVTECRHQVNVSYVTAP